MLFRILFFGDVVGAIGRQGVCRILPSLRETHAPDLVIANAENLAHGAGITPITLEELAGAGVDVFTGGNHSWSNPVGIPLLEDPKWKDQIFVPTNYGRAQGGRNVGIVEKNGVRILIVNLMGQLFTHADTTSPFSMLDEVLKTHAADRPLVTFVDFHAEATSEKEALGHYADGRVSAVVGTHTHVPTADAKILTQGTAYVTDVGRCGAQDSVVGFEKKSSIQRFLGNTAGSYEIPKQGRVEINAVLVSIESETGKAVQIDRIREFVDISA